MSETIDKALLLEKLKTYIIPERECVEMSKQVGYNYKIIYRAIRMQVALEIIKEFKLGEVE